MLSWIPIPGWLDLFDIAIVAGFGWLAIRYFRRTRARAAFVGLALLGVVYLLARGMELRLTEALLQGFFAVVVIVLIVVFQEDLRRVFEQLGSWWRGGPEAPAETEVLDVLVRSVVRMAAERTGALIVLPGKEPIERHVEGGIALGGRISEPLLLSIFDSSSPGHDGAAILRGSRVERFAVHLPLSSNHAALGARGTRHAAALGIAERCDAVCIAISEERGTVSVARDGTIRTLERPEDLTAALSAAREDAPEARRWWQGDVGRDAAMAVFGALALWTVFVPGAVVGEATVPAVVEVTNLPADLALESVEPGEVKVTLRGLRRDLVLAQRSEISVRVDAYLARFGRRTFEISVGDVQASETISVVGVEPAKVRISLQSATSDSAPDRS